MTPRQFQRWREEAGWNQIQAATFLGCSVRAVRMYEDGERPIPPLVIVAMHYTPKIAPHRDRNGSRIIPADHPTTAPVH